MASLGTMQVFLIFLVFSSFTIGHRLRLMHGDRELMDGEQMAMEEIGNDRNSSLRCVTTQVNLNCCRKSDGGSHGDWFNPNGSQVTRARDITGRDALARRGYAQEVQLLRLLKSTVVSMFGNYVCRVPDQNGVVFNTTIFLYPTPCRPSYCHVNATCTRVGNILSRSFNCACRKPFEGDGYTCTVPDMCQSSPCPVNSTCIRNGTYNESYYCTCPSAHYWTGHNCSLIPTTPPPATTLHLTTLRLTTLRPTTLPPTTPTIVGVSISDAVIGGGTEEVVDTVVSVPITAIGKNSSAILSAPTSTNTTGIIVGVVLVVTLFLVVLVVVIFLAIVHRDRIMAAVSKRTRAVSTFPEPVATQATPPEDETQRKGRGTGQ